MDMKVFLKNVRKKIALLLLLSGMAVPLFSQHTLKIMTFNIRLDVASDSLDNWQYRKDNLASQVLFYETDILGVQEALTNQMQDLEKLLSEYQHMGVARDTSLKWGEYNAIFYKKDRLKLLDHNTFWLSPHPDQKGVKGWDAALPRIVTWAHFQDVRTNKKFYVFNTHFDHMGINARKESAHLILNEITRITNENPVVLMGDFNSRISEEPYKVLTNERDPLHVVDGRNISINPPYGPYGTFNGFKNSEDEGGPIDFIFVKNKVKVLKHAVFSESWKGRFSSDHFPVYVEIQL